VSFVPNPTSAGFGLGRGPRAKPAEVGRKRQSVFCIWHARREAAGGERSEPGPLPRSLHATRLRLGLGLVTGRGGRDETLVSLVLPVHLRDL